MRALLLSAPGVLGLADVPPPAIGEGDVLVRVRACGICGSDIHGYDGSSGRRIPPLVMGHEAAGVIEAAGAGVQHVAPGDRVTIDSTVSCGQCEYCRRGEINLCNARMVLGVSCGDYRRDGAFAELVSVPARIVYRVPDGMPFEQAALVEAVSVAVHAVARSGVRPGEDAAVIGCGMIGVLVVQALRERGCRTILAVDLDERRRALAARLGATGVVDATHGDAAGTIRRRLQGRGADHVFEVVGRSDTVRAAVGAARKGGTVTLVGNLAPSVDLPLQEVVTREVTLVGSCGSAGEYPACLELMARGAIDVAPLISAVAPLEEGPVWFERLRQARDGLLKVILRP